LCPNSTLTRQLMAPDALLYSFVVHGSTALVGRTQGNAEQFRF
jgi:hypothetical protein